jgi:4-hydroxy-tetrahydrodipicolinate reductase
MTIRVAVAGASGRMGRMLIEAIVAQPDLQLTAALDRADSAALGEDAAAFLGRRCGVPIGSDFSALAGCDVLIDFTRPDGTAAHLPACVAHGVKMVIGTTGFDAAGRSGIAVAAHQIGIVFAPNMSVGVNVTFKLLEVAAKLLADGYDVEIVEAHHRHKVDAPSGTALEMGRVIAAAQDKDFDAVAVFDRHGAPGERQPGTIGFAALRGGDIVGEHSVMFIGRGERIEINHRSTSRQFYADGSLRAARFLMQQAAGLYDMQDVLGLRGT